MSPGTQWWRSAAIYQVYVRSFADGNGDGTGDIAGLRSRLPYLVELGIDAIWVNPWYVSPFHDGGYDVADYRDIDPRLGTLDEATEFIAEAKNLGIRVLVDLVPNHTSSEHAWFKEALASPAGSLARRRYHFCDGRGAGGAEPPTNWKSIFGGAAWTRVPDGQWYLHLFDVTQPDLNWNNPDVIEGMEEVLRFWLDRGAAGFRVDVAHGLVKDPDYPDVVEGKESLLASPDSSGRHPFHDRDEVHDIIRRFRRVIDEHAQDAILVAEAWVENAERLARYLRPDEYHQAFNFDFLLTPWNASALRRAINNAVASAASPTWVLSNHDVVRHATRLGLPPGVEAKYWLLDGDRELLDAERGLRRARAAALMMFALPGAVYIYQGEELGLPEVYDLPVEVLDDPVWTRSGHREKGRDGCRVPLPWTTAGSSYGFGSDGSWLPQPSGWGELSVEAQRGAAGSTLELYRAALRLRKKHLEGAGALGWLGEFGDNTIAFGREGGVCCVVNLGERPIALGERDVLLASEPLEAGRLVPDAAAWIR